MFIYKIYRKNTIKRIDSKINMLGPNHTLKITTFLNSRFLLCLLLFIITLFGTKYGYLQAPILTFIFYYLYEYILLDYPIKKRGIALEKEALFFFEIFTLTLESGRNIKHALEMASNNIHSELSQEFKKAIEEIRLGKSLNESLESLKKRIPSETIRNTILNIMESNQFGNNLVPSMYSQLDYLRQKQLLDAKASIALLPTKISIISVLFFIPIMMLIILAPVLIRYLTS